MIRRKENLLIRPWQQKHYDDHRKKVAKVKPAVDTKPPLPRQHVFLKLKKKQKESERTEEIEKNNFSLLKRLSYVMRTNRVDNSWASPQPNFLNRVAMFKVAEPKYEVLVEEPKPVRSGRKAKCSACTPQSPTRVEIPEERVPWEPTKLATNRQRSKSVPVRKPETKPVVHSKSAGSKRSAKKPAEKVQEFVWKQPTNIVFSRGCLKLELNFPPDTFVKFREGKQEKVLVNPLCNCTAVKA